MFGAPGSGGRPPGYPVVVRPIATAKRLGDMTAEYSFLARYARARTKFTLPAPSYHRRYWSPPASQAAGYGSPEEFLTEIRDYLRSVAHTLIDLGCDYIQLDAPNYGSLCDPDNRARMEAAGVDVDAERFQGQRDFDLLLGIEFAAGHLFAVAQGGIENLNAVRHKSGGQFLNKAESLRPAMLGGAAIAGKSKKKTAPLAS